MRNVHTISLVAVLAVFGGSAASARGAEVALLGEVEVHDSSVFLSDFLPAQIPAEVRSSARKIVIGSAPPPGTDRIFEGDKIANHLGPDLAAEISIPRQIVVHRAGRPITREEVTAAIRVALDHNGFTEADFQPGDIQNLPTVMASSDHPEVRVRRIDFDDDLKEARFLMAEPGRMPFLVTAQLGSKALAAVAARETAPARRSEIAENFAEPLAARAAEVIPPSRLAELLDQRSRSDRESGSAAIGAVALVEPRKMATLSISSPEMQMLLDVTPLEKGALNQTIRVKLPVTGKILRARVVGERRLSAAF